VLERLRVLIKAGRYRVTLHAEQERDSDQVLTSEIEEAFTDQESVILEDYQDDPRGHSSQYSCLTLTALTSENVNQSNLP
jgi:hypothetical protein